MKNKPLVAISSCLLGEKVRYDGDHKAHLLVLEILGPQVDFLPICPEMEAGLGTPREPIHLVQVENHLEVRGNENSSHNPTASLNEVANKRLKDIAHAQAYIFKSGSPSCGLGNLEVRNLGGETLSKDGLGLFAQRVKEKYPELIVKEDSELKTRADINQFLRMLKNQNSEYR